MMSKDKNCCGGNKELNIILDEIIEQFQEYLENLNSNKNCKLTNKILEKKCKNKYFYIDIQKENFIWTLLNDIYNSLTILKLNDIFKTIFFKINYKNVVINLFDKEFIIEKKYFDHFKCKKPIQFGIDIKSYVVMTEELNEIENHKMFINKNDNKKLNIVSFNPDEGEKTLIKFNII